MELTPESIEESTAGFCLKIQGKTLYLTASYHEKFCKLGNNALFAFHKLQEEGLGKIRTQEGSKGPTSVSITDPVVINLRCQEGISYICKYTYLSRVKPEIKCKSTAGSVCQVQTITIRLSSNT